MMNGFSWTKTVSHHGIPEFFRLGFVHVHELNPRWGDSANFADAWGVELAGIPLASWEKTPCKLTTPTKVKALARSC